MKNKIRVIKNIFLVLTVLAVVGLGVFIWQKMPDHFTEMWQYIKFFVLDRSMDNKTIIGYGVVAVGLTVGIIWIIRNLRAGRKFYAFVGPFLFNALLFFGLVFYRDRFFFQRLFGSTTGAKRAEAIIFTALAAAIIIFLIATIISIIVEENNEYKPTFVSSKKNTKTEISNENKEFVQVVCHEVKAVSNTNHHDCEDVRKELLEIKKIVLEVRDLVNEKGLQGRKVLVKKLVTEEIAIDEPTKEEVVSPIPAKEEPVAVMISENDEIKPVDVEEPIDIDSKVDEDNDEPAELEIKPVQEKNTTKFVAQEGSKSPKVIRKPFDEKMAETDLVNKSNYNILKNELLSYGTKSRISHSGDTFRLKRETYAKLSLVGKNLKIYLALNPAEYNDTTIPAKDVSAKKCFEETPTMLHVKSRLSVKRAKLLIAELMKNKELQQGEVKEFDFASEFVAPKKKKAKKAN